MNILKISDQNAVFEISQKMNSTFENKGTVYCCGNGGLASTADHFAAELNKSFIAKRNKRHTLKFELEWFEKLEYGYKLFSLSSNNALLTAISNDIGPEYIYAQQLYNFGSARDTLIVLTTSGNSVNIDYAIEVALSKGMSVLNISGKAISKVDSNVMLEAETVGQKQEEILKFMHQVCMQFE